MKYNINIAEISAVDNARGKIFFIYITKDIHLHI
ncbi:hypothetical protein MHIR_DE00433 [Candidatus Doolittlea endobia]|uniref:Uncharacterized protein n=1 Tax=Candidatus Doolittlea endobia TaxID=1778262 RepID=A0A143WSA8_9ENTR|nr:hypothetical protein MHIR_DE00433 [Candidatus Doolittlea endobia]